MFHFSSLHFIIQNFQFQQFRQLRKTYAVERMQAFLSTVCYFGPVLTKMGMGQEIAAEFPNIVIKDSFANSKSNDYI
jgi:hypothetical protein